MTEYCVIKSNHLEFLINAAKWGHKDIGPDPGRFKEDQMKIGVEAGVKALKNSIDEDAWEECQDVIRQAVYYDFGEWLGKLSESPKMVRLREFIDKTLEDSDD